MRDIRSEQDVFDMVADFYGRAFDDPLLGPVFRDAHLDLDKHLPVMTDFWMTVLFSAGRYRRNALAPHVRLGKRVPLTTRHFSRWLSLWEVTVTQRHAGPVADRARVQAIRIGASLHRRLVGVTDAEGSPERLLWPSAVATRPARSASGQASPARPGSAGPRPHDEGTLGGGST